MTKIKALVAACAVSVVALGAASVPASAQGYYHEHMMHQRYHQHMMMHRYNVMRHRDHLAYKHYVHQRRAMYRHGY